MKRKILIVGGVAGGASAAARLRRLDEQAEIIMFERGPHVSFSNCSLPFYLGDIVESSERLVLMNPTIFQQRYRIDARTLQEVIAINREAKTITIQNHQTKEQYEETYDQLILSPGASPIVPSIKGTDLPHVFTVRNVPDVERIKQYIKLHQSKRITVIGGGYIGVEVAENLQIAGYQVSLISRGNQIMRPFDYDMAQILHKEMHDKGVELKLNSEVAAISNESVTLQTGESLATDVVIFAIGVQPETSLARAADLTIGATGAIKVNTNYQTSDPAIYAVGDAIEVYHRLLHKPVKLALAGPAQRQARAAADHIYGIPHQHKGVIGSSSIQIFDLNSAATGLNEATAKAAGMQVDSVYFFAPDKVGLMPQSNPLHFKLVFEVPTGRILGAQAIGKGNADKRIDVIATLITMGGTLEDLKELELSYSPMYSTAKDVVNIAALIGLNILYGRFKQVKVGEVRQLVEAGAVFLDVRESSEIANGHLKGALHIPLSELRNRLDELPKDVPIYVHCRSSQRSYNAVMAVQQSGFDQVYNVSGSFLGICLYEYFNDITQKRSPIVTKYNFK